jgi:hypothetical protein
MGKTLIRTPLDLRKWNGHPLLTLPYFDQLATVVDVASSVTSRVFRCEYEGNEICYITVHDYKMDKEENEWGRWLIDLLRKARTVAAKTGINPLLSLEKLVEEWEQVEILCGLLIEGHYDVPVPNIRDTLELIAEPPDYEMLGSNSDGTDSVGYQEDGVGIFLGQEIDIKPFAVVYLNVSFRSERRGDDVENYDVLIEGNEKSVLSYCRLEEEPVLK